MLWESKGPGWDQPHAKQKSSVVKEWFFASETHQPASRLQPSICFFGLGFVSFFLVAYQEKQWHPLIFSRIFCWWAVLWSDQAGHRPFGPAINTSSSFIRNGIPGTGAWEGSSSLSLLAILSKFIRFFLSVFTHTFPFRLHFNLSISVTNLMCIFVWDIQYVLPYSYIQQEVTRWVLLFKKAVD